MIGVWIFEVEVVVVFIFYGWNNFVEVFFFNVVFDGVWVVRFWVLFEDIFIFNICVVEKFVIVFCKFRCYKNVEGF